MKKFFEKVLMVLDIVALIKRLREQAEAKRSLKEKTL